MVHAFHRAVVHAAVRHAHIRHRQQGPFAHLRNLTGHAVSGRQGSANGGRAAHGFGKNRIGFGVLRLDQNIVGFGHRQAELIDLDRLHVVAVGLNDRHLETRNADIEIGHRRGIDEPQSNPFTGLKGPGPVLDCAFAVDQRRKALNVLDVGGHHPHVAPGHTIGQGGLETHLFGIGEEIAEGLLFAVVVIGHHLQVP